jgi:ADP-glucose pyrophosphorylase
MGADYYEVKDIHKCVLCYYQSNKRTHPLCVLFCQTEADKKLLAENGGIPIGIGKNCHIKRAIIDKNARIGDNVKVVKLHNISCIIFALSFFTFFISILK